jgi:hypothetical protein
MPNFAEQFIQGFSVGEGIKRRQQESAERDEDRKLQRMMLKHQMDRLKIEEGLERRGALQQYALSRPPEMAKFDPQASAGSQFGAEQVDQSEGPSPYQVPPAQIQGPLAGILAQAQQRLSPREIPSEPIALPEVDLGEGVKIPATVETRNLGDIIRQQALQRRTMAMEEPFTLSAPAGGSAARFAGGEPIASVTASPRPTALPSVEQQEMADWMAKTGKGPAEFLAHRAGLAPSIRIGLEQKALQGEQLSKLDTKEQERIRSVARRVAQGLPVYQGLALLGGRRSGRGMALEEAVSELNAAIIPQAVRTQLVATDDAMKIIDRISNMTEEIIKNPDTKAKAIQSKLLEDFINQQAPFIARAVGHVGVLTQRDVDSVKGLAPGWKSANFAPGFAREKINLLRSRFQEHRDTLMGEQQRIIPQSAPSGGGGVRILKIEPVK